MHDLPVLAASDPLAHHRTELVLEACSDSGMSSSRANSFIQRDGGECTGETSTCTGEELPVTQELDLNVKCDLSSWKDDPHIAATGSSATAQGGLGRLEGSASRHLDLQTSKRTFDNDRPTSQVRTRCITSADRNHSLPRPSLVVRLGRWSGIGCVTRYPSPWTCNSKVLSGHVLHAYVLHRMFYPPLDPQHLNTLLHIPANTEPCYALTLLDLTHAHTGENSTACSDQNAHSADTSSS